MELVYEELLRSTVQCVSPELRRFGELREKIVDVVNSMLRRTLLPTQTYVTHNSEGPQQRRRATWRSFV